MESRLKPRRLPGSRALHITALYAILAAAWIFASDGLVGLIVTDPSLFATIAVAKGLLFVAVTSALLFEVLRTTGLTEGRIKPEADAEQQVTFSIWPPLVIFFVFVAAIAATGLAIFLRVERAARAQAEQTLRTVTSLKVGQIENWLEDRRLNAARAADQRTAAEVEAWMARGSDPADPEAADLLLHLRRVRDLGRWHNVLVVDRSGEVRHFLGEGGKASSLYGQRAVAVAAIRTGELRFWDFAGRHGVNPEHRDFGFIAPLRAGSGASARVVGALMMDVDPALYLYPIISSWPLPSTSGETLLVRRDGNSVLYLSELRHRRNAPLTFRLPIREQAQLIAARAVLGQRGFAEGRDYRGTVVLSRIEAVPQSPWIVISQIDAKEINGPVSQTARLVALLGIVLVIAAAITTTFWLRQQRASALIRHYRAERERMTLTTHLRKHEERALLWAETLESSTEGIVIADASANIVHVNKAFTEMTGYTAEEAVGQNPRILKSGRHDTAFYHVMWRTIRESGRWQGEIWNRRKNGEVYLEWLSITAVRNPAGQLTHYLGISSDITERKESADRIEFLASHDTLTALPNRLLMNDLVRQALATAKRKGCPLALLFLDLDRFKTINDSLGHSIGDELLRTVAVRLTESVREGDTVARLGGDEFLIMLPEIGRSQDAAVVAEKIIVTLRRHMMIEQHELGITGSVGIAVYPDDGDDVSTLVRNADAAMYHAKESGRNNYQFFTPDMNARAFEALSMEMSLRGALTRGEFALQYQPQVETASRRIVGVEALIRWSHRDLGSVSPSRFIPIAEEHGLIIPIGEWVLRAACTQIRKWLDQGLPVVPVAVNLSAVQFRQAGLAERIAAILDETGVSPRYLELELTESAIMHDAEQAIAILLRLNEMGISLSIDDFGTGYSSLSYLRRFPIHKLKIDRSFVNDIPDDADASAIASAIISMARSLKLRVIAEGVETIEQLAFLRAQRCDEMQGFHLAPPMEAEELTEFLKKGTVLEADFVTA